MALRKHLGLIGYSLLAFGVGLALFFQNQNNQKIERVAIETHNSLCAFKGDLQRRYDVLKKLLDDNPGPFPAASLGLPDIPREVLESSRQNRKEILDSLVALDCS